MKDIRATIADALEARVRTGDLGGRVTGDWLYYSFAYAAHAAFTMGEDPVEAARAFIAELPPTTAPQDVEALTFSLWLLEREISDATR